MRRLDNTENVLAGRVAPSQYLLRDDDMRNINKYLPRYSFRAGGGATFLRKFCCHRQVWYVSWLDSRGCGQIGHFTPSILLSSWETALVEHMNTQNIYIHLLLPRSKKKTDDKIKVHVFFIRLSLVLFCCYDIDDNYTKIFLHHFKIFSCVNQYFQILPQNTSVRQ